MHRSLARRRRGLRGALTLVAAVTLAAGGCIEGAKFQGAGDTEVGVAEPAPEVVDVPDEVGAPDPGGPSGDMDVDHDVDIPDEIATPDPDIEVEEPFLPDEVGAPGEVDTPDPGIEVDEVDTPEEVDVPDQFDVPDEVGTETDGETAPPPDRDGDGDPDATDCAPDDPLNGHGLVEVCDGQDNDCDGDSDPGCGMTLRAGLTSGGAAYPLAGQSGQQRLGSVVIGQTLAGPRLVAGPAPRLAPGLVPALRQPAP